MWHSAEDDAVEASDHGNWTSQVSVFFSFVFLQVVKEKMEVQVGPAARIVV